MPGRLRKWTGLCLAAVTLHACADDAGPALGHHLLDLGATPLGVAVEHATALDDGAVLLSGRTSAGATRLWLARVGLGGETVWHTEPDSRWRRSLVAPVALAGGRVALAVVSLSQKTEQNRLVVLDAEGAVRSGSALPAHVKAMWRHGDGVRVVAVGDAGDGFIDFDAQMVPGPFQLVPGKAKTVAVHGRDGAGLWWQEGEGPVFAIRRADPGLPAAVAMTGWFGPHSTGFVRQFSRMANGELAVLADVDPLERPHEAWSLVATADGTIRRGGPVVGLAVDEEAAPIEDGHVWQFGTDAQKRPVLRHADLRTGLLTHTLQVTPADTRLLQVRLRLSETRVLLAGRIAVDGGSRVWWGVADAWGHLTEAAAGVCADKTLAACDDGDPCTDDGCGAAAGCSHTVRQDGAPCGDGRACLGGKCVVPVRVCPIEDDCKQFGRCTAAGTSCVVGSDADCQGVSDCKKYGFCKAIKGECRPGPDVDCKPLHACTFQGYCHLDEIGPGEFLCVPHGDADCASSQLCAEEGYCSILGRNCAQTVSSAEDCLASMECAQWGRCSWTGKFCVAAADADCLASVSCKRSGACATSGAYCLAKTGTHCKESRRCREFGECQVVAGQCRAVTDADCLASFACKVSGACKLVGGVCQR